MDPAEEHNKFEKILQTVGTLIGIIAIPILIGWGINMQKQKAEKYPWSVTFFYPKDTIYDSKRSGFKTLEECREWAQTKAGKLNLKEAEWDYECGTRCEFTDETIKEGTEIHQYECEEITK